MNTLYIHTTLPVSLELTDSLTLMSSLYFSSSFRHFINRVNSIILSQGENMRFLIRRNSKADLAPKLRTFETH